jgi:hypothetical protein
MASGSTVSEIEARTSDAALHAKAVLTSGDYAFCANPHYPLSEAEVRWCPLVGEKSEACPTLPAACKRGATYFGGYVAGEGDSKPWTIQWPKAHLGGIGSALFWTLVILGAFLVVYAIVKRSARFTPERKDTPEAADEPGVEPDDLGQKTLETDVERLLARARRAAAEGRLLEATADAHAALLRQLEGEALIRVHPSSTNGDYVRELAPHPALRSPVREIVRDVERLQFGHDAPSAGLVASVIERVTAVVRSRAPRVRLGALGALSMFLLAAALGSCDPTGRGPWERTPLGNAAVVEFLTRSGFETHVRLQSFTHLPDPETQLVLLPAVAMDPLTWQKLLDWVEGGGTLITTGQHGFLTTAPGFDIVDQLGLGTAARVSPPLQASIGDVHVAVPDGRALRVGPGQQDPDQPETVLARGDSTYAAELAMGEGKLVMFADDALFTNVSLATPDDAAFLVGMLLRGPKRVEIAGELVGKSSPNPVSSVKRSRLWPVMLQLTAFFLVLLLARGIAFGAPRDPAEGSRRRFGDHVRALGSSYQRARVARHASMLYATFALEKLRERVRTGQGKGIAHLADGIAVRSGRPLGEVARVLVMAEDAREPAADDGPSHEPLTLVRELWALLKEVGGGSR